MANRPDLIGRPARRRRARTLAASNVCFLCGKPIDMTLPGTHRYGPTVGHVIPVKRGGHPTDPRNQGSAHLICNLRQGSKLVSELPRTEQPSRDWT